jgi:hypothetical protein
VWQEHDGCAAGRDVHFVWLGIGTHQAFAFTHLDDVVGDVGTFPASLAYTSQLPSKSVGVPPTISECRFN